MTTQPQDPAPAAPMDVATTTAPTPPPETIKTRRPGWSPLPNSNEPATDDSATSGAGSPGSSDELPEPRSTKTGGSRGSSRASTRQLRKAIAVGFAGVTELAHQYLVRDDYGQAVGLLLAEEDEADQVAEPAAGMVGRRMKDLPVGDDVADGMALVIALGAYVLRQLGLWRYARQLRAEGAVIDPGQPDYTHQQQAGDGLEPVPPTPAA